MRVLIVEDSPVAGGVLRDFVEQLGHEAELVRSAEAALRWLQQDRPDLILLDFKLPGMTGLEFLEFREVRESRIPVVVVSGTADERQARGCLKLGAREFVAKPVALERLQRILEGFADERPVRPAKVERRRAPRACVVVPVKGRDPRGAEWETVSVNLSPHGIKVRSAGPARPSATVTLTFVAPGGDVHFEVPSLLVRVDLDGSVFHFSNLTESQLERLTRLVRRLAASPPRS